MPCGTWRTCDGVHGRAAAVNCHVLRPVGAWAWHCVPGVGPVCCCQAPLVLHRHRQRRRGAEQLWTVFSCRTGAAAASSAANYMLCKHCKLNCCCRLPLAAAAGRCVSSPSITVIMLKFSNGRYQHKHSKAMLSNRVTAVLQCPASTTASPWLTTVECSAAHLVHTSCAFCYYGVATWVPAS
jgi:hypothetical protein